MINAPSLYFTIVQVLVVLKYSALDIYLGMVKHITNPDFIKAYRCPLCGSVGLCVYHCRYQRNFIYHDPTTNRIVNGIVDPNKTYPAGQLPGDGVWVYRFLCLQCSRTHAFLPDIIVPWSSHNLLLIYQAVYEVEVGNQSINATAKKYHIERKTLRNWIHRFEGELQCLKDANGHALLPKIETANLKGPVDFLNYIQNFNKIMRYTARVYGVKGVYISSLSAFCRSFYDACGHRFMQSSHLGIQSNSVKYVKRSIAFYKSHGVTVSGRAGNYNNCSITSYVLMSALPFKTLGAYPWQPQWP